MIDQANHVKGQRQGEGHGQDQGQGQIRIRAQFHPPRSGATEGPPPPVQSPHRTASAPSIHPATPRHRQGNCARNRYSGTFFRTFYFVVFFVPSISRAAPPVVDYLFPSGGQQGTIFSLAAGAKAEVKIDPWPASIWIDCPGVEFSPADVNGTFTVHIAKDAPLGPHLVRIYNDDGTSAARLFTVSRHPEITEQEPNDDPAKAQEIASLPVTVNGRLDKTGDADCFSFQVEAGRWIVAELTCHRLGSPVDPALRLIDPDGSEAAFNHDTFGLDPLIAFRAVKSGRYVVQVVGFEYPPGTSVQFAGSKAAVYRLLLTTGPYARYALPAGVQRGGKTSLRLFGWNLGPGGRETTTEFDGAGIPANADHVLLGIPQLDNVLRLPADDGPVQLRIEPSDTAIPQTVHLPTTITGRLNQRGEVHRFSFPAKKDQVYRFAVTPLDWGLPLDAVLTIDDAAGKQLGRFDDGPNGASEPMVEWSAPGDGTYVVALSDLNHHGGEEFVYRVEMKPVLPDFRAALDTHAVRVEPGKSAEIKVTISRKGGYAAPLAAVVTGLPDGVTASTPGASAKGDPITVTLNATANAKPVSYPIQILVVSADVERPAIRRASFQVDPVQLVKDIDTVWLTVAHPPATPK